MIKSAWDCIKIEGILQLHTSHIEVNQIKTIKLQ